MYGGGWYINTYWYHQHVLQMLFVNSERAQGQEWETQGPSAGRGESTRWGSGDGEGEVLRKGTRE